MSTKIYTAWRCRAKAFDRVLAELHSHAENYAVGVVKEQAGRLFQKDVNREIRTIIKPGTDPWGWSQLRKDKVTRVRMVLENCVEASRQPQRTFTDIDASLNVWYDRGWFYIIGYGECWGFDYNPVAAEDYRYWNNTDRPDDLTPRQWRARGAAWNRVCLDTGWNARRMTHAIIEAKSETGLAELAARLLPKGVCYGFAMPRN